MLAGGEDNQLRGYCSGDDAGDNHSPADGDGDDGGGNKDNSDSDHYHVSRNGDTGDNDKMNSCVLNWMRNDSQHWRPAQKPAPVLE